jgi:dihydroorotate dehydrogenase
MIDLYKGLLRPFLFSLEAEQAHHLSFLLMKMARYFPLADALFPKLENKKLACHLAGMELKNPVGLAAGMDKNAELVDIWPKLGFGFAEIGTVTPRPQIGNPRPRLFRIPQDQAIINRMGFNNDGMEAVARRLSKRKADGFVLGGNIGKNKNTPNQEAHLDYVKCFSCLFDLVDYFTINVSSPNTPGLRQLLEKESLVRILEPVQNLNAQKPKSKPVFLKIAPDVDLTLLPEMAEVCQTYGLQGMVATNTTVSRKCLSLDENRMEQLGAGGLSGKPLSDASFQILSALSKLNSGLILMSSGGIMDEQEAQNRFQNGASAIQLYSGFVYEGPALINRIKDKLIDLNNQDGKESSLAN